MHICLYWQVLDAVHNDINVEIWDNLVCMGRDSTTDLLFDGLQHGLKMKGGPTLAMMNLGQENGMILTRCAFAVMIKF